MLSDSDSLFKEDLVHLLSIITFESLIDINISALIYTEIK
jgi:hypothetical protein